MGNIKNAVFGEPKVVVDVKAITPRALTDREVGWIKEILQVSRSWQDADITRAQVVAEGFYGVSPCFKLRAPTPENPSFQSAQEAVRSVWIETADGAVINIQLSQFEGRLTELYVLFVDTKHPRRKLPDTWIEHSHQAVRCD